ncbi:MAG: hypothetical protein JWQ81_8509 [Amycolatopsis sp.]|uniref:hypothetical protein n=1 Tax=Amycolatopsis sp. TaxID=37632 RepID=UPI0026338E15|nr:hypothetical protein [Amycolatopsis sp.]MCU1687770.1 hypothetical protein [Amycolatopsis sp.]
MVTAKVNCTQKVESGTDADRQVLLSFQAVTDADGSNKEWAKYTPHLQMNMTVIGAVADHFEAGKPYLLQFVDYTD